MYLASKSRKKDYRPSENVESHDQKKFPMCEDVLMVLSGQVKDSKRDKVYLKHSILGVDDALRTFYMVKSGLVQQIPRI